MNIAKYHNLLKIEINNYKTKLFKEINKLEKLLDEELTMNLDPDQRIKIINKIFAQQTKISNIKISFEKIKLELNEELKTPETIEKEKIQREKSFNGMTAKEWTLSSRNVWNDVSSPRKPYHKEHGAVYPLKLAERLIRMYSRPGDTILDPFSGTSTTLNAAMNLDRNSIGIELSDRFFNLSKRILLDSEEFELVRHCNILSNTITDDQIFSLETNESAKLIGNKANINLTLYKEDCRNMLSLVKKDSIQALITSPPYANFIQKSLEDRSKVHKNSLIKFSNNSTVNVYSDSQKDMGNLDYSNFISEIGNLMKKTYEVIKPGGYSIWVVKDYKNKDNFSSYLDFHTDIAKAGEKAGFFYHDLIIWDQNEQRSLMLLGYPSKFHTNQNASFLVVLRKPNQKEYKELIKRQEIENVIK